MPVPLSPYRRIVNRVGAATCAMRQKNRTILMHPTVLLWLGPMTDERLILAIGRIERALARLESRGAPARPGLTQDPAVEALAQLQSRYDRLEEKQRHLRERTATALSRLTALIDRQKAD